MVNNSSTKAPDLEEIFEIPEVYGPPPDIVDVDLVNGAVLEIKSIYLKHAQMAYLEVANYLFENFFDSNMDLMRKKTPVLGKVESFNELVRKLKEDDVSLPGRTWLHNSVRLLAEKKDIDGLDIEEVVRTYGQLPVSHKIVMLPLEIEQKKDLILKIEEDNLTVRQTKEKVAELLNRSNKEGAGKVVNFDKKIVSIEKTVSEWQSQIGKAVKIGSGNVEEFKKLEKLLKKVLVGVQKLQETDNK